MLQINPLGLQVRWRLKQLYSCAPMFSDMNGFRTNEHVTWRNLWDTRTDRICVSFRFGYFVLPRLFEKYFYTKWIWNTFFNTFFQYVFNHYVCVHNMLQSSSKVRQMEHTLNWSMEYALTRMYWNVLDMLERATRTNLLIASEAISH